MKFFRSLNFFVLFMLIAGPELCAQNLKINTVIGRVFIKKTDQEPFSVCPGNVQIASETSIITFLDGQCYFVPLEKVEFRMREESILAVYPTGGYEIRKGTIGCSSDQITVPIDTPHIRFKLHHGVVVVKTNSVLTRVALIKGKMEIEHQRSAAVELSPGHEIAAGLGTLSSAYKISDDLRFAWYWVDPSKEPSLQP